MRKVGEAVAEKPGRWKKLGIGVILAFTIKGLITISLLALALLHVTG